jgi:hypothetical protein
MHQITILGESYAFDRTSLMHVNRRKNKGDAWSDGSKVGPIFANAAIPIMPNAVGGIGKDHFGLFLVMYKLVRSTSWLILDSML